MVLPDPLANALRTDLTLREVDAQLYSVFEVEEVGAPYDNKAAAYDRMVSSDRYLRLAWGARRSTISRFMERAFASGEGPICDLAAGTSVDAYRIYAGTDRPTFVVDLSLEMLRKGRDRLRAELGALSSHIMFLQADAMNLPFRDNALSAILCHGGFHLLPSLDRIVSEWKRVLDDQGRLFASSLVKERLIGNLYLHALWRLGEVSRPMSAKTVAELIGEGMGKATQVAVEGNFAYVRTD